MIAKNEDQLYVITCDGLDCGIEFIGDEDFLDSLDSAKAEGWVVKKGELTYFHYCPNCVAKQKQVKR